MSEQSVTEKLAAAGFAQVEGMTHFYVCESGYMVAEIDGCAAAFSSTGKCLTDNYANLVPLPAPATERLSDAVLEDYVSLGECQAKSMATECIASRREHAELREQVATLTRERDEAIAECGRLQRNLESTKNAIELVQRDRDTLTREKDDAKAKIGRLQYLVDSDASLLRDRANEVVMITAERDEEYPRVFGIWHQIHRKWYHDVFASLEDARLLAFQTDRVVELISAPEVEELVAAAVAAERTAERERCAKCCYGFIDGTAQQILKAIEKGGTK